MKHKICILLFPAFILLLLLHSCVMDECEPHEPVNTYYKIGDFDKNKIPFTGTDTLVYISTDGDTAILYGQGKKAINEKITVDRDPDPGCTKNDYNYFEKIMFTYSGNNASLNEVLIDISAHEYGSDYSKIALILNNNNNRVNFRALNSVSNYKDSLIVEKTTYYGIKVYGEPNLYYLYNYQFGFLQITTTNKVWIKRF